MDQKFNADDFAIKLLRHEMGPALNPSMKIDCLEDGPITVEEVKKQISKMKKRKAPGFDQITPGPDFTKEI